MKKKCKLQLEVELVIMPDNCFRAGKYTAGFVTLKVRKHKLGLIHTVYTKRQNISEHEYVVLPLITAIHQTFLNFHNCENQFIDREREREKEKDRYSCERCRGSALPRDMVHRLNKNVLDFITAQTFDLGVPWFHLF